MLGAKRTLAIMAFTLVSCSAQVVPATTPTTNAVVLRLNASNATLPLLTDLTQQYAKIMPGVSFEINVSNYASAVENAFSDDPVYFLTNHLPPEDNALWGAPVAHDAIVLIVPTDSVVRDLTLEQVRGIYQGRIKNWAEVGGTSIEIVVISREDGAGTRAEFERMVMGDRQTTQSAQIAPSSSAVLASVMNQPGSIGYVSLSFLDVTVLPLTIDNVAPSQTTVRQNTYPLRNTLFFAGPREPDGALRAFIGWAQSPAGQAVVAQRYIPLTMP
ncbi:MAG: hypothetical protein CL610_02920 [Anaerolineaceae bacterium]|nr:hypothetical protein [Anaerolineaceae bacterium]